LRNCHFRLGLILCPPKKTMPIGLLVRVPAMPPVPLAGMPALSRLPGAGIRYVDAPQPFPRPAKQAKTIPFSTA
jgi:hypothetical protein